MKLFNKFLFLLIKFAMVGYLLSCTAEQLPSASEVSIDQSAMLFNRITLSTDENGEFIFLDEKSKIQPIVENLFMHKNKLLEKVDDFGLGKDDSGEPFFYVKEVTDQKTQTIFVYLKSGNPVSTRANSVGGIKCVNVYCCDECVVNNGSCVCYDQNSECQANGETRFECSESSVNIAISLP